METIYDKFNELTVEDFKEMTPEEVTFWYGVGQQQSQAEQMRKALINNADVKEAERQSNTIKIDSKVIN